jgi:hypothetical protein
MRSTSSDGKRIGAFTVVEVIVALSLLAILLTGIYGVLTLGFRNAREAEIFETVHREALVGMKKITDEVVLTTKATVNPLASGSDHLVFASPQKPNGTPDHHLYTYDGNGNLQWYKWVCFYRDAGNNTVYRAEIPIDPSSAPAPAPPAASSQPPLTDFINLPANERVPVFRNCNLLQFNDGATAPATVRVTLETEKDVNSDKQTRMHLENEVAPRNNP